MRRIAALLRVSVIARVTCRAVISALVGSISFGSSVTAQEGMPGAAVMSGARVRVTYPGINRRVGTLVALHRDTLVARWESGATSRMALRRVTELDISAGRFPHMRAGAKDGAALGFAGGIIVTTLARENFSTIAAGGVYGAVYGAVAGAVVGTVWRTDTWRPILGAGEARRVGLASSPLRAGPHIGLSRSF